MITMHQHFQPTKTNIPTRPLQVPRRKNRFSVTFSRGLPPIFRAMSVAGAFISWITSSYKKEKACS